MVSEILHLIPTAVGPVMMTAEEEQIKSMMPSSTSAWVHTHLAETAAIVVRK